MEPLFIEFLVKILENIENHLLHRSFALEKVFHCLHGDVRRQFVGKMKFPGGNAAERHALQAVFRRQFQAGTVAGGQQLPVALGHPAGDDRADGVKNVFCRKIVSLRQLGLPVETTLTLISDQWKVLILRDLIPGTKRFGELKKSIGNVSQKVLTAQLRQMEDSGLLTRTVYPEVPPRVEYTLTDLGRSLKPILDAMWTWGENYKQNQA